MLDSNVIDSKFFGAETVGIFKHENALKLAIAMIKDAVVIKLYVLHPRLAYDMLLCVKYRK